MRKKTAVSEALNGARLPLLPANVSIEPGTEQQIQVSITRDGTSTTLIDRQGKGSFGPSTPAEIVEAIRRAI